MSQNSQWRRYGADRRGALLPVTALIINVLLLSVGVALDVARVSAAQRSLQEAADTAALAAGRALMENKTLGEASAIARAYISQNSQNIGGYGSISSVAVSLDASTGKSNVTIQGAVPTTLMRLAGYSSISVPVTSTTQFNRNAVEVAMVLDITGSMDGSKLADLKTAANNAIDILLPSGSTSSTTRIALVPFADAVNAGSYARRVTNNASRNCVHERAGSQRFTDAMPRGSNGWLGYTLGMTCPAATIVPLSVNGADLKRRVNSFLADGGTAGHIGLAWGWYTVSDKWAPIWPNASDPQPTSPNVLKAVILMTDGEFNAQYVTSNGTSEFQASQLCTNMKAAGITLYTVAFQAPTAAETLLRTCASAPGNYFSTSTGGALQAAFQSIANNINRLRITQ